GLEAHEQNRGGALEVRVADRHRLACDMRGEERGFLVAVRSGAEIDVVGAEYDPRELRIGVGVFNRGPATDEDPGATVRSRESRARDTEGFRPGRRPELAILLANERGGDAVADARVVERPAALVAVPFLVHLRVVAGQAAQHFSAP